MATPAVTEPIGSQIPLRPIKEEIPLRPLSVLPSRKLNQLPTRPLGQLPLRPISGTTPEERVAAQIINPDTFAKSFLQTDLWDTQEKIMRSVAMKPRVAVKACHASSKTHMAARILLWALARYTEVIVVTTAPTWGQVEKLLWGEVHSALLNSKYPYPKATLTELKLGPKRYAYGLSTSVTKQDEGVKFQGIHATYVLIILDEAPGVDPKIWDAIQGNRAGGNVHVLAIGNPTISSGPFYNAFTEERSGWDTHTINAFDTPNLRGLTLEQLLELPEDELDNNVRPYLITRRWVKEMYYEWGPGHPLWEARVLGNFPVQDEHALLSLTWLEQAKINSKQGSDRAKAGIDVAGPGEAETTLCIRRGPQILYQGFWAQPDPRGEIVTALNPYKGELEAVNVDSIGVGWGMYLHLKDLKFPAFPVNVCETSHDPEKYDSIKSEYYWGLRMRFLAQDVSCLLDERTIGQLAGIRYKHNSRGQVEIESKDDALKRGVKSPDRAESVMLAFAEQRLVYGVNEFYKQELEKMKRMAEILASQMMKPTTSDVALKCPKCEATCCVRCAGGWRCNQCGEQWYGPGDKKPPQPKAARQLAKISR